MMEDTITIGKTDFNVEYEIHGEIPYSISDPGEPAWIEVTRIEPEKFEYLPKIVKELENYYF